MQTDGSDPAVTIPEVMNEVLFGMGEVIRGQILAFVDQPRHLIPSPLLPSKSADEGVGLTVFVGVEDLSTSCAVVPTTLSLLDWSATITFKALSSSTPDDGRPTTRRF